MGCVSVNSFIGQYLPLIQFPQEMTDAVTKGEINLHKASQLARLTPERLDCPPARAKSAWAVMLRERVKEILGEVVSVSTQQMANAVYSIERRRRKKLVSKMKV